MDPLAPLNLFCYGDDTEAYVSHVHERLALSRLPDRAYIAPHRDDESQLEEPDQKRPRLSDFKPGDLSLNTIISAANEALPLVLSGASSAIERPVQNAIALSRRLPVRIIQAAGRRSRDRERDMRFGLCKIADDQWAASCPFQECRQSEQYKTSSTGTRPQVRKWLTTHDRLYHTRFVDAEGCPVWFGCNYWQDQDGKWSVKCKCGEAKQKESEYALKVWLENHIKTSRRKQHKCQTAVNSQGASEQESADEEPNATRVPFVPPLFPDNVGTGK